MGLPPSSDSSSMAKEMPDAHNVKAKTLKYVSLVTLVLQNAALALSMRYSRTRDGDMFTSSTAVVMAEILKFFICLYAVYCEHMNIGLWLKDLKTTLITNYKDTLKVCIPSFVYVIQNNLLYVAASHLDAATYQVSYQLKILTTAIFSIFMLRKKLNIHQWTSLLLLVTGVVLVQLVKSDGHHSSSKNAHEQYRLVGFLAAISACFLSGFAGVYFEKILKGSPVTVWMRNVQLSLCSIPFGFIMCYAYDHERLLEKGFFYGYDAYIWYLVTLQAGGGLLVAMVVKYADNILKGFATSLAIIVACVFSIILFDFQVTLQFSVGTALVISSIFLYGYQPPAKPSPVISRV